MLFVQFIRNSFTAIVYFAFVAAFFILSKIMKLLTSFSAQTLKVPSKEAALNGVSFIIPSWNKQEILLKCLRLLDERLVQEATSIPKEIIVIDNGSTDSTLTALKAFKTKTQLTILASPVNLGFAKAINWGVEQAQFNYVYLLNNDMEVQPDFCQNLLNSAKKLLKQHRSFFGLASQIFFFDLNKKREESGKTYCEERFGSLNVAHYVEPFALSNTSLTLYPGGGAALFNRKLFLQLGGYDYAVYTPLYCEDLDAGIVAWKLGQPSFFEPTSIVLHHHQSSSRQLSQPPEFFLHKNLLAVILKNYESMGATLRHLYFYPLRILTSGRHQQYAWETLKNLPTIWWSKIWLYRFRIKHSDQKILNFVSFEFEYVSKSV